MDDFERTGFLRKNVIWIVVLLAIIVFGLLLFKDWDRVINDEIDGMVTITGNFGCLPLKAEEALPTSDEEACTLGVRSRDGLHYALDISRIQDANTDLKVEDTIAVTGTVYESADHLMDPKWSSYDIKGVILVNTLLRTR